ncbi:MAG: hypothetical protein FWC56_02265, partial [Phycisphaerae bacterium]|nr:hypothetical protein [Phycisphaerae bacterium]
MKILFLTHRLPCPPDRGCKLRSAAILFGLAQQHDVWCAGFLDAETDTESKDRTRQSLVSLRNVCRGAIAQRFRPWQAKFNALRHLITGQTATEGYFASRRFTQRVHRLAQLVPFDAVFAFSSSMAPLALSVPAKRRVLCMDDLDSQKWIELANSSRWPMRHLYNTEARRLGNRELEWIDRFDATLVISQREADLVTDARLRKKIHICPPILPSPISSSTTSVATSITENAATNDRELDVAMTEPIVGFVGAMDYQPNIDAASWLAREIWPHVRQVWPDAKLW